MLLPYEEGFEKPFYEQGKKKTPNNSNPTKTKTTNEQTCLKRLYQFIDRISFEKYENLICVFILNSINILAALIIVFLEFFNEKTNFSNLLFIYIDRITIIVLAFFFFLPINTLVCILEY